MVSSVVVFLAMAYFVYQQSYPATTAVNANDSACTQEAMLCPDGVTYVGRSGPNCEFAACPGSTDINQQSTNIKAENDAGDLTTYTNATNGATKDWKTYTNENGLYSVQYPKDWEYAPGSRGNPSMFYDPRARSQTQETELLIGSKIEIYYSENDSATVSEAVPQPDEGSTLLTEVPAILDAKAAIRRTVRSSFGGIFINQLHVLSGGKLFTFVQYIVEDAWIEEYSSVFDQMLPTFTFTQ